MNDDLNSLFEHNHKPKPPVQRIYFMGSTGPTGPSGKGLEILGSYDTLDELMNEHPTGNAGDSYIINGDLYIWDQSSDSWKDIGNVKGPKGDCETFTIDETITGEVGSKAQVIDTKDNLNHKLKFIIPKGDVGPQGPIGPEGKEGPAGPIIETSYNAIFFASYAQAHYSKIMNFQDLIDIPENNEFFTRLNDTEFSINNPGFYEITLCGQISGVDQNHGAIFYLSDKKGSVIQDLSFKLDAGSTTRMDCSETIITKLEEPTTMYIQCGIIGDASTAKIDFANVNLIVKKYNVSV